jgi:hypothetical protein
VNAFAYPVEDAFYDRVNLAVDILREREEIGLEHLKILIHQIKLDGFLKRATTVYQNAILHASKQLAGKLLPKTSKHVRLEDEVIL